MRDVGSVLRNVARHRSQSPTMRPRHVGSRPFDFSGRVRPGTCRCLRDAGNHRACGAERERTSEITPASINRHDVAFGSDTGAPVSAIDPARARSLHRVFNHANIVPLECVGGDTAGFLVPIHDLVFGSVAARNDALAAAIHLDGSMAGRRSSRYEARTLSRTTMWNSIYRPDGSTFTTGRDGADRISCPGLFLRTSFRSRFRTGDMLPFRSNSTASPFV